jgi:hypothetical protein
VTATERTRIGSYGSFRLVAGHDDARPRTIDATFPLWRTSGPSSCAVGVSALPPRHRPMLPRRLGERPTRTCSPLIDETARTCAPPIPPDAADPRHRQRRTPRPSVTEAGPY